MIRLSVKQESCFQVLYALYAINAFIALDKLHSMPICCSMKCVRNSVTSYELHLYVIEIIRNNGKRIVSEKSYRPELSSLGKICKML